jgi:hypothetical protein
MLSKEHSKSSSQSWAGEPYNPPNLTLLSQLTTVLRGRRETFDGIYLDLSKESGKLRFAETGFGWKPSGGGDTFTQDAANIGGAQWSRASKGYEVKIVQRGGGVVQMDGFSLEVRVTREKDGLHGSGPGRASVASIISHVSYGSKDGGGISAN